jgi:hypothetical protein
MKKLLGILTLLLLFASCNSNKEVKLFVDNFASAIEKGEKTTIEQMYPDAIEANSLQIAYNADSVSIESNGKENQYVVNLISNQSIIVEKKQDGQFCVLESKGLFAYESGLKDFCKALGCYDPTLSDKDNAERMRDSSFVEYLNTVVADVVKDKVRLEEKEGGNWENIIFSCIVHNETEFDLPKDSYVLTGKVYHDSDCGPALVSTYKFSDKTIDKGETVEFVFPERFGYLVYSAEWDFVMKKTDMTTLQKIYKPLGNEYQTYSKCSN